MKELANFIGLNMPRYRLSKPLFYLLVFFLPFQTRKIFFTEQSFYFGYHAFYNTWFLYLTDLVFCGLMVAWLWENWQEQPKLPSFRTRLKAFFHRIYTGFSQDNLYLLLGVFWLILASSLMFSQEITLGWYGLVKISEFFLFFAYIRENIKSYLQFSREMTKLFWVILVTAWFQSILGIFQYLNQSSFGLKWLGEEFLHPGIKGIAEFFSHGVVNSRISDFFPYLSPISDATVNIRAYGTLPHPNVLAGFLFLALFLNLYLLFVSREKFISSLSLILISTGLTVTFSRFSWFITGLGLFFWLGFAFFKIRKSAQTNMISREIMAEQSSLRRLVWIVGVLLLSLALNWFLFGQQITDRLGLSEIKNLETSESYSVRGFYNNVAWDMIVKKPFSGVGWKNFVVAMDGFSKEQLLPYFHQPVHNIYLLVAAEAGIVGLGLFLAILFNIVRRGIRNLKANPLQQDTLLIIIIFGFLIWGFFDHFFLTIQQGSLMFWLVLGLAAIKNHGLVAASEFKEKEASGDAGN